MGRITRNCVPTLFFYNSIGDKIFKYNIRANTYFISDYFSHFI